MHNMPSYSVFVLEGIPEIRPGDALSEILVRSQSSTPLQNGDILVLAHKIVSKAEGRMFSLAEIRPGKDAQDYAAICGKDPRLVQVILNDSSEVLWCDPAGLLLCRHKLGYICANAGVDCSNSEPGYVISLPENPDASAERLRIELEAALGIRLSIIICDTQGRPFRVAACGIAIGASGIALQKAYIGDADRAGRIMQSTVEGIGDELASAATLVMGQGAEGLPAAVIRGYQNKPVSDSALKMIRPLDEDLFYRAMREYASQRERGLA